MKVKLVVPLHSKDNLLIVSGEQGIAVEPGQDSSDQYECYALIDSNKYRQVENLLKNLEGYVEVFENVSSVRQVTDIESEQVNLQVRPDFDGNLSDSEDEIDINSVLTHQANKKKQKKKSHREKEQPEQQQEQQEQEGYEMPSQKRGKLGQLKAEEKNQSSKGNVKKNQREKLKEQQMQKYQDREHQKKEQEDKEKKEQESLGQNLKSTVQATDGSRTWNCTSCVGAVFSSSGEYRTHFKCEWHLSNLRRKMNKQSPFDFDQFRESQLD